MSRRQSLSLLLALTYGIIAVAGHGLHALVPCDDVNCDGANCDSGCELASATTHCDCCCDHAPSEATGTSDGGDDGPAFRTPGGGVHQPHTCAVCALLSKMKEGRSSQHQLVGTSKHVLFEGVLRVETCQPVVFRTLGPRGPPVLNS